MRTPALTLALSLLLAACGGKVVVDPPEEDPVPTCAEVCEKALMACGGSAADCAQSCAQMEQIAETLCSTDWTAWLLCVDENASAQCQATNACDAETNSLTNCVITACTTNPTACLP